jgi:chemotaxis protein MotB
MELARALQGLSAGRRFLVTDHMDEEALKAKHYHSLWELTATRAVAVVEYLVSLGVPAASLTPAGGGSNDPLARNDTPENRAKNRRVEIALLAATDDAPAPR